LKSSNTGNFGKNWDPANSERLQETGRKHPYQQMSHRLEIIGEF